MARFGSMAPMMPTLAKPKTGKIAKPKKIKVGGMAAYRGVSQQHIGGPDQAPIAAPAAPAGGGGASGGSASDEGGV